MAGYPATPSFRVVPGGSAPHNPTYHGAPGTKAYEYDERPHPANASSFGQNRGVSAAGVSYNGTFQDLNGASAGSSLPPLPILRGWDPTGYYQSEGVSLRGTPGSRDGYGTPNSNFEGRENNYDSSSFPKPREPFATSKPASGLQAQVVEEGELSEGEFEDGPQRDISIQYSGNRPSPRHSYQKRPDLANISAPPLTDKYGRSLDLNRQRSDSYSPAPYDQPKKSSGTAVQNGYNRPIEPNPHFDHIIATGREESTYQGLGIAERDFEGLPQREEQLPPGKSLPEARKEAQNAVLRLWPLQVRFQNYVEEGIDEQVIRSIFKDIGMSPTQGINKAHTLEPDAQRPETFGEWQPPQSSFNYKSEGQPSSSVGTNKPVSHENRRSLGSGAPHETLSPEYTPSLLPAESSTATSAHKLNGKVEERKDRIARLLTEKNKKLAISSQDQSSPSTSTLPTFTSQPKPAATANSQSAKADKEKLLRQKMEALQKSREARALKATVKTAFAPNIPSNTTSSSQDQISHQFQLESQPKTQPPSESEQPTSTASASPLLRSVQADDNLRANSFSPQKLQPSQHPLPMIPGLFLATSTSVPQPTQNAGNPQNNIINQRKRPVASDFDTVSMSDAPYKRPFGHNKNDQPLVIDVSDDESEADIDNHLETGNLPKDSPMRSNTSRPRIGIWDQPALSDFPPRKIFTTSSSSLSTAPIVQSIPRPPISGTEDLLKKEREIQEMRKKIAEAERRKKARQNASGSQTPMQNDSTLSENDTSKDSSISAKIEASVQIERMIDVTSRKIDEDQQMLADAQAIEQQRAEELKKTESEQRHKRRVKLAHDLPVVNAEVEKSQQRLADLRAEMERIEVAVQQGLQEKQRLAEEMEKLGQEVDEQLDAEKDHLRTLDREMIKENEVIPQAFSEAIDVSSPSSEAAEDIAVAPSMEVVPADTRPVPAPPIDNLLLPASIEELAVTEPEAPLPSSNEAIQPVRRTSLPTRELTPEPVQSGNNEDQALLLTADQALEVALQDASAEDDVVSTALDADVFMEDSFAPDPNILAEDRSLPSDVDVNHDTSLGNDPEEAIEIYSDAGGSSAMDIDDYAPDPATSPLPEDIHDITTETSINQSNDIELADGASENENYEPREASLHTKQPPSAHSSPFSPEPPNHEPSPTSTLTPLFPLQDNNASSQNSISEHRHKEINEKALDIVQDHPNLPFYTPYESPLKYFKDYRFHPEFTKDVAGGYKSITYSNNINAFKEFCRFELAGGICNDATCEFQHFRDIALPDEQILVALGNSAGYKEEDKFKFIKGLKVVLQDLRERKIRDFQVIASKICAFRQNFLEDKSKVLLLDTQV